MIVKFFYLQTSLSWTVNVALIFITEKKLPQPNSMETDQTRTLIVTLITDERAKYMYSRLRRPIQQKTDHRKTPN